MIIGFIIFGCIMLLSGAMFGALWLMRRGPPGPPGSIEYIRWQASILDDLEEEYQLNVIDCHPFEGTPPINLKQYRDQTRRKVRQT